MCAARRSVEIHAQHLTDELPCAAPDDGPMSDIAAIPGVRRNTLGALAFSTAAVTVCRFQSSIFWEDQKHQLRYAVPRAAQMQPAALDARNWAGSAAASEVSIEGYTVDQAVQTTSRQLVI